MNFKTTLASVICTVSSALYPYSTLSALLPLSTPQEVAVISSQGEFLIGGVFSPLGKEIYLSEVDLIAKGAQPISLSRVYIAPHIPKNFHPKPDWDEAMLYQHLKDHYTGWEYLCHLKLQLSEDPLPLVRFTEPNGITVEYRLSGPNLFHTELVSPAFGVTNYYGGTLSGKNDLRNVKITYAKEGSQISVNYPDGTARIYKRIQLGTEHLLDREILPNQKVIRYNYDSENKLTTIESLDPQMLYVYATLYIEGSPEKGVVRFRTSSGESASYNYGQRSFNRTLTDRSKVKHEYDLLSPPILMSVISSFNQKELIQYESKFLLSQFSSKDLDLQLNYVPDESEYSINEFTVGGKDSYKLELRAPKLGSMDGSCVVRYKNGTYDEFTLSKNLLIQAIRTFSNDKHCLKEKLFHWASNGWLSSVEERDGNRELLYRRTYEYDRFGNPIQEVLVGELTGEGKLDSYTIRREYSKDGKNLMLREEKEDGIVQSWSYVIGTDLVATKFIWDQGKIILREFRLYDDFNNLIQVITDNGSGSELANQMGVTETLTTTYRLKQKQPFIHLPEWVETASGSKLIKKVHFSYDSHGNVSQEKIYDAAGKLAYTLYKDYNEKGLLVSETNPIGQKAFYTYDDHGKVATVTGFAKKPPVVRLEDTTQVVYDAFGRKVVQIDAKGNKTRFTYNALNFPILIQYPDGTTEIFRYSKDGKVASHVDQEGRTTHFTYDTQGRVLSKSTLVSEETYTYDATHLLSHQDKEGNLTTYTYDAQGRLSSVETLGSVTESEYDVLGRVSKICKTNGDNSLYIHKSYDLLDRVIGEKFTDGENNLLQSVSCTYDKAGHLSGKVTNNSGQTGTEAFSYDSLGREIMHRDASGNIWETVFNDHQKTTIDPLGARTIETFDNRQRLVKIEKISSGEFTTFYTEFAYDANDNRTREAISIFEREKVSKELVTTYSYDVMNRLVTKDENGVRVTSFTYTPCGYLQTKTQPDGNILSYAYDELGHLSHLVSSDGLIDYSFSHNKNGQLVSASDNRSSLRLERKLTPSGLIEEESVNGMALLQKSYDAFGRPLSIHLPDGSSIRYSYDSLFLRNVSKVSKTGKVEYEHNYDVYNVRGDLVLEESLAGIASITHTYTPNGLPQSLESAYFFQSNLYNLVGCLVSATTPQGTSQYSYDDLYHVSSYNDVKSQEALNYSFDSLFRLIEKNGTQATASSLDQILSLGKITLSYDKNGNQVSKQGPEQTFLYSFDPLGRLTQVLWKDKRVDFTYDPLGRLYSKASYVQTASGWSQNATENYFFDGDVEIGTLSSKGQLKSLRVLGYRSIPIALELNSKTYLPLSNLEGNLCVLIDPETKLATHHYKVGPFGEILMPEVNAVNPWFYQSFHYQDELGLYTDGYRFYDPQLIRYLNQSERSFHEHR